MRPPLEERTIAGLHGFVAANVLSRYVVRGGADNYIFFVLRAARAKT